MFCQLLEPVQNDDDAWPRLGGGVQVFPGSDQNPLAVSGDVEHLDLTRGVEFEGLRGSGCREQGRGRHVEADGGLGVTSVHDVPAVTSPERKESLV